MSIANLIRQVRLLIQDRKKIVRNLQIGIGDGSEDIFRVPILTVQTLPDTTPDLNIVFFDPDAVENAYIDAIIANFDYEVGDAQVSPVPETGQVVIAYFSYVTYTDDEITFMLGRTEISNCPYTCAAVLLQGIIADTSRMISFSQSDAKYDFSKVSDRLERQVERYLKQSIITGDSIAVPFVPDVLSRLDYIPAPLVYANTPYARF